MKYISKQELKKHPLAAYSLIGVGVGASLDLLVLGTAAISGKLNYFIEEPYLLAKLPAYCGFVGLFYGVFRKE